MPDNIVYAYDSTLDGFLTCIFEMYEKKEHPAAIFKSDRIQLVFGQRLRDIETDLKKADRVYKGISEKIGGKTLDMIYYSTLSCEHDAETAAMEFVRLGLKIGKRIHDSLTDSRVDRLLKVAKHVSKEQMRYIEFLRFGALEGGVLFAEFEPEPHVLPLIMPHFTDRLNVQPFIIHDKGRGLAGVYDTKQWYLISSQDMTLPEKSKDERDYRKLWKTFYNTVAIKERISEKRRMQHLPKKYWNYVTELRGCRQ